MGEGSEKTTAVKIYKQTYHLRSGDDPEYVKRLAEYVDAKMNEIFERTSTVDSLKVAVLAALNVVDEYFMTKEKLDTLEESVATKTDQMLAILDNVIETDRRA